MESKRKAPSSFKQKINSVRAKVDMLIKQKLDKKHKGSSTDRKKRHSTLDMVQYYDYDDDVQQERDVPINEQETQNKENKVSINAKIKRGKNVSIITFHIENQKHGKFLKLISIFQLTAGKPSSKLGDLGKKKNENAEAMTREKHRKAQAKDKEPKEKIIVDIGVRKNKTAKSDRSNKKPLSSLGSSFENMFDEERQLLTKENLEKNRQNKDFANNVYDEEPTAAKSKW